MEGAAVVLVEAIEWGLIGLVCGGLLMTAGNGIYTLGCIGATLIMGIDFYWWGISGEARSDQLWIFVVFIVVAFVIWLLGRVCRHVFDNFTHST